MIAVTDNIIMSLGLESGDSDSETISTSGNSDSDTKSDLTVAIVLAAKCARVFT